MKLSDEEKRKSNKWDKQEKRTGDFGLQIEEIISKFLPLLGAWERRPQSIKVELKLSPKQLKDLADLSKIWMDEEELKLKETMKQLERDSKE